MHVEGHLRIFTDCILNRRDDDGIVVDVWFMYILRCADGALYVGKTNDVDSRFPKHNEGSASHFTARRRPVNLAYAETFRNRAAGVGSRAATERLDACEEGGPDRRRPERTASVVAVHMLGFRGTPAASTKIPTLSSSSQL